MTIPMIGTATKAGDGASVFLAPDTGMAPAAMQQLVNNPQMISNLVAARSENSLAIRVFGGTGTTNAGSNFYTQLNSEDLEAEGVKERAEGTEYPMVRITPPDLNRLDSKDIGGKFRVTDEAMEEGVIDIFKTGVAMISNTLTNYLDDMVVAALQQSAMSAGEIMLGNSWKTTRLSGATPTAPTETPAADLIQAQAYLASNGFRAVGNLLVLNSLDEATLKIVYGDSYNDLLQSLALEVVSSPRLPQGDAYLVDTVGLGGVASKKGLVTETWRDNTIRSTWVQTYIEPAVFVSLPSNVVKIADINHVSETEGA